ncbi:1-aminocyclopropane-1-carboxylate oxidase homolog 1-like [Andrographis paniculata]|uniref:1-aminocyclopropane-1-carboxylate oxidase homolog 1-like n=1 Tax=Andrographis paniculata TaxID=175694 RepID=UPI0021E7C492|nr:1-aminocyclopropane-1-carboxylate oxidase homolog 1-like [Andrographis paniculata]
MNLSSLKEFLPTPAAAAVDSGRLAELQAFEKSKAGVKGLVDSGIQTVPRIFIRPPEDRAGDPIQGGDWEVPVIDLTGIESDRRRKIVSDVGEASREWGFFQVVNHGIPAEVLELMLGGVREFHEQETEKKTALHSRDMMQQVKYSSNIDLYRSRAANWRDTLTVSLTMSDQIQPHLLPQVCRDSTLDYIDHVKKLADILFELLSEALGLERGHLGALGCNQGRVVLCHYYPPCPEPEFTLGTSSHTDPSFLTILLQDQLGGLQVLHDKKYINVQPVSGSLVVNIGDMLQIISNDEFISADHRVIANKIGPRISVASFFSGESRSGKIYAPLPNKQPRYKEFTVRDYIIKFTQRPIEKSGLDEFRLPEE